MRRFSLIPTNRKGFIPQTPIKNSNGENNKEKNENVRNLRDKDYRIKCANNVLNFLIQNNYEGVVTEKVLLSPSTKEFQNIVKFICGFIDTSIMYKFEDDVIFIIKTLKYPYSNEITRSQLSSVTPHSWPALLSMISWLCDLIKRSNELNMSINSTKNLDLVFFNHSCKEYNDFMMNEINEKSEEIFLKKIEEDFVEKDEELEEHKNIIEILENEIQSLQEKFEDVNKLEIKRNELKDELNNLVSQSNQFDIKKEKMKENILAIKVQLNEIEKVVKNLTIERNALREKVSIQEVDMEAIHGLNEEKLKYFKTIEKLKKQEEILSNERARLQNRFLKLKDVYEDIIYEISLLKNIPVDDILLEYDNMEDISEKIEILKVTGVENKDVLLKQELELSNLETKIADLTMEEEDLDKKYIYSEGKLKEIDSFYSESKNKFDENQQNSVNEMDKLENNLLKLKLDSDSVFLKSEKDFSECQIELDVLNSQITREKDEISKSVWDLKNFTGNQKKVIADMKNELEDLLK